MKRRHIRAEQISIFHVRNGSRHLVLIASIAILARAPAQAGGLPHHIAAHVDALPALPARLPLGAVRTFGLPRPRFVELKGAARPVVPGLEKLRCYDTEFGWIFVRNTEQTTKLAEDVRAAAAAFLRSFGAVPGRGVIVVIESTQSLAVDGLRKAGAQWIMPWIDTGKPAMPANDESIRTQIRRQMGSFARDDRVEQVMKQIRSQMQAGGPMQSGLPTQIRPLRHELGHAWFVRYVYGIDPLRTTHVRFSPHYGGPAPDWLDESAAILMEDDATTAMRRQHFRRMLQPNGPQGAIIPLTTLFTMEHPDAGADGTESGGKAAHAPRASDGRMHVTMRIVTGDGAGGAEMMKTAFFYEECRSLIDFLTARTHNPHLYREIAEADKGHLSVAAWLAHNGPRYGLPGTVDRLEKQWLAWARRQSASPSGIAPMMMPRLGVEKAASASALFAANRFAAARDAYRRALMAAPQDAALRNGLTRTLLRLDEWHAALAQGKKAVEIAPDCADAHGLYALTLLRAGQPAAAAREAADALRLDPDDYWGLVAQGRLELWEQDRQKAGVTLRRAADLKPREPDAWFYLIGASTGEQAKEQHRLMDTYLALHPHGHPHDMGVEELSGMRKMLDSFGAETPFRAATPELEATLQAADVGQTPPVSFTIPIQSREHAVLIAMVVQGRKMDLLFDTGGGTGVLLARSTAEQLRLPSLGTVMVRGVGGKEPARQFKAETLVLGDLKLRGVPIHAVGGDLGPFDGVFGVRSLDPYVVTVDFAGSALTLARGKAAKAPPPQHGDRVVQLPFHDLGGNMIIPVAIEGHETWAMIDTGASTDLMMSLELAHSVAAKRVRDSWREGEMPGRGGVGTTVTTQSILMFRDPISLRLGDGGVVNADVIPVTMAAGTDTVDKQLSPAYEFQVGGIIGIGLLMQAKRVTFDYPHHMLTLEYAAGS